jgi:hypothetical protein
MLECAAERSIAHLASFLTFSFCTDNPYAANQDDGIRRILTTGTRAAEREMKTAVDLQALEVAGQAAFANFRHTFLE